MSERTEKTASHGMITEKMINIHMIIIFGVCLAFGVVNLVSGAAVIGIATLLMGIAVPVALFCIKKKVSLTLCGTILSQAQLITIILISTAKHELHCMFPLILASMSIAAVYYSQKNLIIHWVIMDTACLAGLLFRPVFYEGADMGFLLKGILGINIGAALICYLIKCILGFIESSRLSHEETERLLVQVNEQMNSTEKLMANQNSVVAQIADISEKLNGSASLMEQISSALNSAADDQHSIVEDIASDIESITCEAEKSIGESEKASEAAKSSTDMLLENNSEVKNMVSAMGEITEASHQIESIIKAIEDIAFQTNILALNAAVEAARAGAAGKGFAVVADEVRNLATKSAEAAKNTSALIQTTIDAVDKGTLLAENVAKRMEDVIRLSQESTEQSAAIIRLTESQADSARSAESKMQRISESAAGSLKTAEESAQIAHSVSEQVRKMNMIVKSINS